MPELCPTPWRLECDAPWVPEADRGHSWYVLDANGDLVDEGDIKTMEICRRIVACVNACAGIDTSVLDRLPTDPILRLKRLGQIATYQAGAYGERRAELAQEICDQCANLDSSTSPPTCET
jgi:hypothetical protein